MKVPLLDLQPQYAPIRKEILDAITAVADSQHFILGPQVEQLERELESYLNVKAAIGVSSGTDALLAALMAIGVGPGDEVVTSTYSFFATAGCVARLGAKPVLVDIDPVTYNLDPKAVAAAITPRTKAIIPVHLYGLSADMDPILEAADAAGIAVIEDAAQAIGAQYKGRNVGGLGILGCFSFFPSKNLSGFGDSGLITSKDEAMGAHVKLLRGHGAKPKYYHKIVGGNFRIDALQAAVLRVKLPHLKGWTDLRRRNAKRYDELIAAAGLASRGVVVPVEPEGYFHVFNQYVISAPRRDELRAHLQSRGIGTEIYYPVPFHLQECFADLGHREGAFPRAEAATKQTLALPVYPGLDEAQQAHVVDSIREFYG
jgi:dTDP-4-amino-4,6-dideoxygalactose transaminase